MHPWDIAAGALLVLKAGGMVGPINLRDELLASAHILAATPKINDEMRAILLESPVQ